MFFNNIKDNNFQLYNNNKDFLLSKHLSSEKSSTPISNKNTHFLNNTADKILVNKSNIKITQEPSTKIKKNIVYVISNIEGGGSKKYLDDIINHYTMINFIMIKNQKELFSINFKPDDLIFLQHLLFCDILPQHIINLKKIYKFKIVLTIHDFCWFTNGSTNISDNPIKFYEYSYLNYIDVNPNIIELFNNIDLIIHPSEFTYNQYSKYFSKDNFILYPHNDILISYDTKCVPLIKNNNINIAHYQELSKYKGSHNVLLLKNKYTYYKGYKINIITDIQYNETNWLYILKQKNIHGLLHLNLFGETYSYSLSKSINSGLAILYNGIGSIRKRLTHKNSHYFKVINYEDEYNDNHKLFMIFEKMLDYIIENNGKYNIFNNNNKIYYNELYDFIFGNMYREKMSSIIHSKIKPFAIYFPQFHSLPENNTNYYYGMTDIKNLNALNYESEIQLDTPSLIEYNLSKITDYDLTNTEIIHKQVLIAKNYGIYGFAVYYYWFSNNSITNKNTIMENCYDNFFKSNLDFKVFFIWANEDWKGNPAFNTQHDISNVYNVENFNKNISNLILYFKHENYYKVDNKPIFYIHHPYLIDDDKISLFQHLLNKLCIQNGFDGATLYLNDMTKEYKGFNNYSFHPNYKSSPQLNYGKYIQEKVKDNSNCIFLDFNNSARLYIPNKLHLSTKYLNVNIYNQNEFITKVLKKYKKNKIDNNILLINSWNEWGENMAVEPGNLLHYKYLSLFKINLLSFLST